MTSSGATVELCTCSGEPADRLTSDDPALLAYLARHPNSDDSGARYGGCETDGTNTGMASFPASDPPPSWTWEIEDRR